MVIEPPDGTSLCVVKENVVTADVVFVVNLSAAAIDMLTDVTVPSITVGSRVNSSTIFMIT